MLMDVGRTLITTSYTQIEIIMKYQYTGGPWRYMKYMKYTSTSLLILWNT